VHGWMQRAGGRVYLLRERTELLYLKDEQNLDKIMWGEDGCGGHLVDEAELGGEQRSERRESFVRKVECYNVPAVLRREAEAW
jgi:hypothetical protein